MSLRTLKLEVLTGSLQVIPNIADFECRYLKNFQQKRMNGLPSSSLQEISKYLRLNERAAASTLEEELFSVVTHWDRLTRSSVESWNVRVGSEMLSLRRLVMCLRWSWRGRCVLLQELWSVFLSQYNLLTDVYHVIGMLYKFLFPLSIPQVACERSFPTLSFVKPGCVVHCSRSTWSIQQTSYSGSFWCLSVWISTNYLGYSDSCWYESA